MLCCCEKLAKHRRDTVGNDVFVVSRQKDKSFFLFDVD